ncbi:MAG TPA: PEP-CTERM sorting domain-containing protein [Verrucomicrobiae bacterium]|nr:PEP-CTERM sorting domain-containing protein [Verrucomicrobiae bacterium]
MKRARVAGSASFWIKLVALMVVSSGLGFNQLQAATPTLYESAYTGPGGAANFYKVNPDTGAATLIGAIGFNQVGAIDFDPSGGALYAVGNRVSDGTQVLLTINPTTGAGTEIGPTTLSGNVQDISFRNSDDALFGYSGGYIYTFNITTGVATLLGDTGDGFPSGNGLAFDPFDTLYKADNNNLWTINQSTGAGTSVLSLSYPIAGSRANGMDFDNSTGILWASVNAGSGGSGMNYLATINVDNGDVTEVGMTQSGSDALVVSIALIPEPGTFTLVGLGLVGLLTLRRRKK